MLLAAAALPTARATGPLARWTKVLPKHKVSNAQFPIFMNIAQKLDALVEQAGGQKSPLPAHLAIPVQKFRDALNIVASHKHPIVVTKSGSDPTSKETGGLKDGESFFVGSPETGIEALLGIAPAGNKPARKILAQGYEQRHQVTSSESVSGDGVVVFDWLAAINPLHNRWDIFSPGVLTGLEKNEQTLNEWGPAPVRDVFRDVKENILGSVHFDDRLKTVALDKLYQTGKMDLARGGPRPTPPKIDAKAKGEGQLELTNQRDRVRHTFEIAPTTDRMPNIVYDLAIDDIPVQRLRIKPDDFGYPGYELEINRNMNEVMKELGYLSVK